MTIGQLLGEANELTSASIRFARDIDYTSSGDTLGRIVRDTMENNASAYAAVRAVVQQRVDELGGAGQAIGLFMLAADLATTEALIGDQLEVDRRSELRRLWHDLIARR